MSFDQIAAIREGVRSLVPDPLLVVTASHTHSGPSIGLLRDTEVASEAFRRGLVDSIVSIVLEAVENAVPADVLVGSAVSDIGVNRRLPTPEGIQLEMNPVGPRDREVIVLRVQSADGMPVACWFRMAAHPVTLGARDYRISGDWPGEAARLVGDSVGVREALFAQGCCGDVNPIEMGSEQALLHIGQLAARAVGEAWRTASPLEPAQWRAVLRVIDLPTARVPSEDELPARLEIQALLLGKFAIVGLSAEPFSRIAAWVKGLLPETKITAVLAYTNGCFGYLPDEEAFERPEGQRGYEVDCAPHWFRTPVLSPEAVAVAKNGIGEAVSVLLDACVDST